MKDKYTYTCIAHIEYWNDSKGEHGQETITFTGVSNFTEAMALVESWYDKDLARCDIQLLDTPFIVITDDVCDKILNGNPI